MLILVGGFALASSPAFADQTVHASYYGNSKGTSKFDRRRTASGQKFSSHRLTAAHRSLPFGTNVRLQHPKTGRSIVVVINDRGPFVRGRHLDVSWAAADRLGFARSGVTNLRMKVLR